MLTAKRAVELFLLLAGFISTILVVKWAVESSCSYDKVLLTLRKSWSYFRIWLSSPFYICIIMNFIVFLIAASSLFHHHKLENNGEALSVGGTEDDDFQSSLPPSPSSPPTVPPPMQNNHQNHHGNAKKASGLPSTAAAATISFEDHHCHEIWKDVEVQNCTLKNESLAEAKEIKEVESLDSSAKVTTAQKSTQLTTIKKGQRKAIEKKRQQEASKEQVETKNAEEDDTMEATWRAITGEGAKAQNKQLEKRETWPQPTRGFPSQEDIELEELMPSADAPKELKKSMTFNDTISIRRRGGLMRGPLISLEEFNGIVEAFIKKCNYESRLQRQESEQRYLDMINRSL